MNRSFHFSSLITIALMFVANTAYGAEGEAAQYAEKCKAAINYSGPSAPTSINAMNMGFCLGLMDGLRGTNYFLKKSDPSSAFCEPATFDNSDLAKTFVAAVAANPELKELRGSLAALIALHTAFPCKKEK